MVTQGFLTEKYDRGAPGAGIDSNAIIPPDGVSDGQILEWDTTTETWVAVDQASGPSGGLNQAAVDARVRAGVEDWAEQGNTDAIPSGKLTNAPQGDITSVVAGTGLSGGATTGVATVNIANDGVGTTQLADGSVTNAKIGADAVDSGKIADEAVNIEHLNVTGTQASGQVIKVNSSNNGLIWADDDSGAGGGGDITGITAGTGLSGGGTSGTVTLRIDDGGVGATQLADDAVTHSKIADDSVRSAQIEDGAVDADRIASTAVTTAKIRNKNVTVGKLEDAVVNRLNTATPASAQYAYYDGTKWTTQAVATGTLLTESEHDAVDAIDGTKFEDIALTRGGIIASGSGGVPTGFYGTGRPTTTPFTIPSGATWILVFTRYASASPDGDITRVVFSDGSATPPIRVGTSVNTAGGWSSTTSTGTGFNDEWQDYIYRGPIVAGAATLEEVSQIKAALIPDAAELADGSVTTAKLADSAVTTAKIAADAVNADRIADDSIGLDQINATGQAAGRVLKVNAADNALEWAVDNTGAGGSVNAGDVSASTSGFNRILESTDNNVQLALDRLDNAGIPIVETLPTSGLVAGQVAILRGANDASISLHWVAGSSSTPASIAFTSASFNFPSFHVGFSAGLPGEADAGTVTTTGVSGILFSFRSVGTGYARVIALPSVVPETRGTNGSDDRLRVTITDAGTSSTIVSNYEIPFERALGNGNRQFTGRLRTWSGGRSGAAYTVQIQRQLANGSWVNLAFVSAAWQEYVVSGSGLNQTQVDARVRALVEDFAEVGTTDTIAAGRIASNAITSAKIAANAVTTAKLDALAVGTGQLAPNAVTNDKIADNAVTDDQIADAAVGTGAIADDAVTQAKLADDSVGADQVADDAVGISQLLVTGTAKAGDIIKVSTGGASLEWAAESSGEGGGGTGDIEGVTAGTGLAGGGTTGTVTLRLDDNANQVVDTLRGIGITPVSGADAGVLAVQTSQVNLSIANMARFYNTQGEIVPYTVPSPTSNPWVLVGIANGKVSQISQYFLKHDRTQITPDIGDDGWTNLGRGTVGNARNFTFFRRQFTGFVWSADPVTVEDLVKIDDRLIPRSVVDDIVEAWAEKGRMDLIPAGKLPVASASSSGIINSTRFNMITNSLQVDDIHGTAEIQNNEIEDADAVLLDDASVSTGSELKEIRFSQLDERWYKQDAKRDDVFNAFTGGGWANSTTAEIAVVSSSDARPRFDGTAPTLAQAQGFSYSAAPDDVSPRQTNQFSTYRLPIAAQNRLSSWRWTSSETDEPLTVVPISGTTLLGMDTTHLYYTYNVADAPVGAKFRIQELDPYELDRAHVNVDDVFPAGGSDGNVLTLTDAQNRTREWRGTTHGYGGLTEILSRHAQGLSITNTSSPVFSTQVTPSPDLDITGMHGIIFVDVEWRITGGSVNTINFLPNVGTGVGATPVSDAVYTMEESDSVSYASVLAGTTYLSGNIRGVKLADLDATVYSGAATLGTASVYVSRDSNDNVTFYSHWLGASGAESLTLTPYYTVSYLSTAPVDDRTVVTLSDSVPEDVGTTAASGAGTAASRDTHVHELADGVVATTKIANSAVTAAKIGSSEVTSAKIADNAITKAKVADDAVGIAELDIKGTQGAGKHVAVNAANTELTYVDAPTGGGTTTRTAPEDLLDHTTDFTIALILLGIAM